MLFSKTFCFNYIVYLISWRAVGLLDGTITNSDHVAFSLRRVQNQYHGLGELISFLAKFNGHLLVLTEGNIPYHMKIIIKFAPFIDNYYFIDQ